MEKFSPEVTTIIPTYKRSNLLKRAIESALNQTYQNIKVMVFDDCSNDDTFKIVNDIMLKDKRVSYYCHDENIGGNRNFNFGLEKVTTPFFSFLSNDDILLPEFYETSMEFLLKFPEIGFCATEVKSVDNQEVILSLSNSNFEEGYYSIKDGLISILKNGHPPCWTGIVFRSSILYKIGKLDEQVGGSMDYDFVQRAAAYFPFYISKKICAIFCVDESSWGHSSGYKFYWPYWNKMISNISDDEKLDPITRVKFKIFYAKQLRNKIYYHGRQDIKFKKFDRAYECAEILSNHLNSKILAAQLIFIGKFIENYPLSYPFINSLINKKNLLTRLKQYLIRYY